MDGDKQTRDRRLALIVLLAGLTLLLLSLGMRARAETPPAEEATTETRSQIRAARRAYDGAPPVIPHEDFGLECAGCHDAEGGMELEEGAVAPPNPHLETRGLSDQARCRQCHVFKTTDEVFRENAFVGLPQDLRHGGRLHPLAPPTIPHPVFMRENCAACHTGPAAREEIRTSHPERTRCRQCHVEVTTREGFAASGR